MYFHIFRALRSGRLEQNIYHSTYISFSLFQITQNIAYAPKIPTPLAEMLSTAIQFSQTGYINKKDWFGYGDFDSKLGFSVTSKIYFMVSCLFRKHLLTYGFVIVDGTEKLHQPKRRASIAGHSISLSFFFRSAVCLLISQNVNKKLIGIDRNFQMDIFWTKTPKNHFLRVKLLPKIIF